MTSSAAETTDTPQVGDLAPEVMECEDGDLFYIDGHGWSDEQARIAVAIHLTSTRYVIDHDTTAAFMLASNATVERRWYHWPEDSGNDEDLRPCGEADPGAHPFLLLAVDEDLSYHD